MKLSSTGLAHIGLRVWEQAQHQVVTRLGQEQWQALRASLKATMTLAQSV